MTGKSGKVYNQLRIRIKSLNYQYLVAKTYYIPGKIYHYIFFSLWNCSANKVHSTCFLHKCTTQMTWAFTYLNLCCSNYNNSSSRLVVHTIGQSGVVHIIIADNQPFGSLMRVRGLLSHLWMNGHHFSQLVWERSCVMPNNYSICMDNGLTHVVIA